MKTIPIRSLPAQAGRATPAAAPWRFSRLLSAPHRLAFAAAALMLGLSAAWWALALLARAQGWSLPWAVPPALAHGLLMGLGFVPLFFAGFLFTAGPKWLGHPPVAARSLQSPVAAVLAGWAVFALGVHAPSGALGALLGGLGLSAVALGWSGLLWRFWRLLRTSGAGDKTHARVIAAAGLVGAAALWASAFGIATAAHDLVRAATLAALWGFVGVVYAAVAHRMIPFFTASALPVLDAWRPMWLFVAVLGTEAVFAVAELRWWPLPGVLRGAQAAFELAMGAALLALRWGLVQSLRLRLLAMLHLGFVWLGLALLLSGVSHALMASRDSTLSLGLAPLHAYTMGFLGSTLIAMVTRVSCGHSGRTLVADNFVWRLFWLLQLAVLVRVAAALASSLGNALADPLVLVSVFVWAGCCAAWALRYGRWYGQPRVDGRPG